MKKRYVAFFLAALLVLGSLAVCAFATQAQLNYVTDEAGLFSAEELAKLESRAKAISEEYNFGVYIVTLPDYRDYTSSSSIAACAMELYDGYTLGWGSDRGGTMLLLSMQERDFNLDFNSSRANGIFTEPGRDAMETRFIRYFRNDDFYGGFREYLTTCEEYLRAAQEGHPVGEEESHASPALALIPGGIAALLVGLFTTAPMRTAKVQRDADQYRYGRLNLRRRSDMFLHRTVTRSPRNTESSGSGSSGGAHSSSYSSGSHSGRSGKF